MAGLRSKTPCDFDGICPYGAQYSNDCEYWCGAEEPEDDEELDVEDLEDMDLEDQLEYLLSDDVSEIGFDPYLGCYTDDC